VPPVTWTCPSCGRRVPTRVAECHCGVQRDEALRTARSAAAPRPSARGGAPPRRGPSIGWKKVWREAPRDVKAFAIGFVLVAVAAIVWLFVPHRPRPITPVLGWSGAVTAPTPEPTPTPRAGAPAQPPKKEKKKWLPWW
jgi:hypothetical protein